VSGAGYSGVTSMEIIDNAIPHIGGEEEKMETESQKLLGTFDGAQVQWHDVDVSASCNRIPTLDGHLENVFADLVEDATPEDVAEAFEAFPSADRPQPRLDRNRDNGMSISTGGIQSTTGGVQFNCLAHNTLRGAAGASILNGELLLETGYI
ncbi:MAG: Asd/ArgC dimerization domain-containing protein, partial [Halapricum sp.]